jgi:hypothetical protein
VPHVRFVYQDSVLRLNCLFLTLSASLTRRMGAYCDNVLINSVMCADAFMLFFLIFVANGIRPRTDSCNGTSNVTCNVMRILRLDVTAIIACNVRRMVRSVPSADSSFLEHKGCGLGSQYTFGRLFSVYACVDVCSRTRKAPAMSICPFGMFVMTADPRIRGCIRSVLVCRLYNSHYITRYITRVCTRPYVVFILSDILLFVFLKH